MFGENQLSIDEAESWSTLLLASYKIPLTPTWRMALEPVVKVADRAPAKREHHRALDDIREMRLLEQTFDPPEPR